VNDVMQETADDVEHEPFRQFLREHPEFRPQEKDFAMKSYGKRSISDGSVTSSDSPHSSPVRPEPAPILLPEIDGAGTKIASSSIDTSCILPGMDRLL
jgi:hypothetical protein